MWREAAERWDQRYTDEPRFAKYDRPRPFLLEQAHLLPPAGFALDAATGLGANAGFLITRGYRVVGVDISLVGLRRAKTTHSSLQAVQADLNAFYLPEAAFDVILNFYYLQRSLWPRYWRALRPGGILILETLTYAMRLVKPEIEERFLLERGELPPAFSALGFEILVHREGWRESEPGHPRAIASLVARRPL